MSENQMPEQDEVALNAQPPTEEEIAGAQEAEAAEPEPQELPPALRNVDPAKLAALRDKLKRFVKKDDGTVAAAPEAEADPSKGPVNLGKDVDWSEYDLPYDVRHLYPQATFRETPQGPKWVAMIDEFHSETKNFGSHGQKRNKGQGDAINLGEYLNDMLNSPEGWRLVSILPSGMGQAGIVLQRQTPVVLPDPKPLKKETVVEAPTEGELKKEEDAGLAFAQAEGLAPEQPAQEPEATDGEAVQGERQ